MHQNLGNVFDESGNRSAAIEHYRLWAALDPTDAQASKALGTALLWSGQSKEGTARCLEAVSLSAEDAVVHLISLVIHGSMDPWIPGSLDPWIHGSLDPWIHPGIYEITTKLRRSCDEVTSKLRRKWDKRGFPEIPHKDGSKIGPR